MTQFDTICCNRTICPDRGHVLEVACWRSLTKGSILEVQQTSPTLGTPWRPQAVPEGLTLDRGCSEPEALLFRGGFGRALAMRSLSSAGCS